MTTTPDPPIRSALLISNLPFAIAGRTFYYLSLAIVFPFVHGIILVERENLVCDCGYLYKRTRLDVEGVILQSILTIRTLPRLDSTATARTLVGTVSAANRATHTNVSFLTDHITQAMNAAAMVPMTETTLLSMIDITNAEIAAIANTPDMVVRKMHPRMPMTFMKVLLTIVSICI